MTGSSGGGGSSQTTSTTSGPPPQVMEAYGRLVNAASNQAQQPLQVYGAPMVAGFTPQQQQAFSTIGNAQGIGTPYLNAAAQMYGQATTPLWPTLPKFGEDTLAPFMSPYTEDVTGALTDTFNTQNDRQFSQIRGDAAMRGAYGGDRGDVAQALAAGEQQRAQAPVLADVQQKGYAQAVAQFNQERQQQLAAEQANAWLASQAAQGFGALGAEAQSLAMSGAQGLLGVGGMQQQLAQSQMNIPYQQFIQQQAYPYQQLGFLAPIIQGTGSLSGGQGSTTSPGPSMWSQLAGLGTAGAGIAGLFGGSGGGGSGTDWNYGGGGIDFEFDPANPNPFFFNGGGRVGHAEGGSIGMAGGGMAPPEIPGIGQGVPAIDLDYIPQAAPGGIPSSMGMGMGPQTTTTTQGGGGGGGGGIGGIIGPAISIATKLFGFAEGGDTSATDQKRPAAGGIGVPGGIGIPGLPQVPTINLDYIIHPGPAIKGAGPPKPPPVPQQAQDDPGKDITGAAKALKGSGLFGSGGLGSSGDTESDYASGGGVPASVAANFGGAPPPAQSAMQQLALLPLSRLEQMAVQFPPTTQQGKMIAQAIAQKKATVGAGTAPEAPGAPAAAPGGMAGGIGGGMQQPQMAPSQDYGGTAHTLAEGGDAGHGYVTEDELDPHPIIDHSGDTVVVRYPSEGKVLDLGIPSFKGPAHLAAGGSAGAFPHVTWSGDQWGIAPSSAAPSAPDHLPITGPANNAPLGGTAQAPQGNWVGSASPFLSSMPSASGVAIPQLSSNLFLPTSGIGAGTQPGGGIGDWFQPMEQYHPPGSGPIGPGGTMMFPGRTAYTPQMAGIIPALNPGLGASNLPVWAGGPDPGVPGVAAAPAAPATPEQQLMDFFNGLGNTDTGGGGEKRGGRIGYAGGGDVDEFGMEDYVPPRRDWVAEEGSPRLGMGPGTLDVLSRHNEPGAPLASDTRLDLPDWLKPQKPTLSPGGARNFSREPPVRGFTLDLPTAEWRNLGAKQDRGESPETRRVLSDRGAEDIPPANHAIAPAELRALRARGDQAGPGTLETLAEHEAVDRPGFYSRARSFGSLPSGPAAENSPYAYALAPPGAPWGNMANAASGVQEQPMGGMTLPPAGLGTGGDYVEPPAGPVDVAGVVEPMAGAGGLGIPASAASLGDWSSRYPGGRTGADIDQITATGAPRGIGAARPAPAPGRSGNPIVVDGKEYANPRAWRLAVDAREAADPGGDRFEGRPVGSGSGVPQVYGTPSQPQTTPFGPGVVRGPEGALTRNGQPPDTRIAGQPAWQTGGPGNMVTPSQATGSRGPEWRPGQKMTWYQVADLAREVGFQGDGIPIITGIVGGESGFNPNAYNGRGENSYGLTQINADAHGQVAKEAFGNPRRAMELAFQVSKGGTDFTPWSVYKNGTYRSYMQPGSVGAGGGSGVAVAGLTDRSEKPSAQQSNVSPTELRAIGPQAAGIGRELADRIAHGRPDRAAQIREMWPILAIAAGAGMLASRSPFPGVAIGEGLGAGVKAYQAERGLDNKEALAAQRAETTAQREAASAGLLDLKRDALRQTETNQAAMRGEVNQRIMATAARDAADRAKDLADIAHRTAALNQTIAQSGLNEVHKKEKERLEQEALVLRREAQKPIEYKDVQNPKTGEGGTLMLPSGYKGETDPWETPGARFLPSAKSTTAPTPQQYAKDVMDIVSKDINPTGAWERAVERLALLGIYAPGAGPPKGSPPETRLGKDPAGNPVWVVPDPARPGKYLQIPPVK